MFMLPVILCSIIRSIYFDFVPVSGTELLKLLGFSKCLELEVKVSFVMLMR